MHVCYQIDLFFLSFCFLFLFQSQVVFPLWFLNLKRMNIILIMNTIHESVFFLLLFFLPFHECMLMFQTSYRSGSLLLFWLNRQWKGSFGISFLHWSMQACIFLQKEIHVKIICFENIFVNSEKGKTNFCRFDGSLSLIITIHMCINCIDIKSNLLSTSIFLFTALITYTCNLHIYFCLWISLFS